MNDGYVCRWGRVLWSGVCSAVSAALCCCERVCLKISGFGFNSQSWGVFCTTVSCSGHHKRGCETISSCCRSVCTLYFSLSSHLLCCSPCKWSFKRTCVITHLFSKTTSLEIIKLSVMLVWQWNCLFFFLLNHIHSLHIVISSIYFNWVYFI